MAVGGDASGASRHPPTMPLASRCKFWDELPELGMPMIEAKHVSKHYRTRKGTLRALDDVNLVIEDGDMFGIIGESGAGKSTLVRCINLLERPTLGSILIDGRDVTNLRGTDLRRFRSSVGMIFQNFGLFQQRTVLDNVTFPLELAHVDRCEARRRARALLERVGIPEKAQGYPSELSGGQQQRVAIARALVNEPKIMLCDEATSALDTRTTIQILDLLRSLNREMGVTIVLITHSLDVARRATNRIAVIDRGRIAEEGPTDLVLDDPQSEPTRLLIAHSQGTIDDKEVL